MKEKLLAIFNDSNFDYPLDIDEIYSKLKLKSSSDFTLLAKILNELEDDFIITHNKSGAFASLKYFNMCIGILDVKDQGYGFVDTPDGGIFINSNSLKNAITYDTVMIKVRKDHLNRFEGEVVRIIKRGNQYFYGILQTKNHKYFLQSIDNKIKITIFINSSELKNAKTNDMVKVQILKYFPNHTADGKVVEVLGKSSTARVDIDALVLTSGVPVTFKEETLKEMEQIASNVSSKDLEGRIDLTSQMIITIDGASAKDLDDAISVKRLENGNYLLGVYIADVSYYVRNDTFLDLDALERGTSIYLADRVIPMLPKKLSNGICSLNENEIRLVMGCEMEINILGEVVNHHIFEGYIKNKHRMTYDEVNEMIDGNQEINNKYQDIKIMINQAYALSKILSTARIKRGSFEFESPEAELILNQKGKVTDIVLKTRRSAECMIEEFMLCCNETIATVMSYLDVPFLYRVHESPKQEKINKLLMIVSGFGYEYKIKNKKSTQKVLQAILQDNDLNEPNLSQSELTKRGIINTMLIRTMSKATYQEANIGHFGLASKCYTHFTSPIRRYPDLLVHRLIKEFLLCSSNQQLNNPIDYYNCLVSKVGNSASKAERIAERLERDVENYKKCEYMEQFVGNKFVGTISEITNFGMYVTLDNTVEGIVLFKEMYDDYYLYDESLNMVIGTRFKKVYNLGDRVKLRLMSSKKNERKIIFRILGKE